MNKQRVLISAFLCAFLALNPPITSFGEESDPSGAVRVEYDDLRTLLKEGNLTLKKTIADQEDTINAYQEMWDTMKGPRPCLPCYPVPISWYPTSPGRH